MQTEHSLYMEGPGLPSKAEVAPKVDDELLVDVSMLNIVSNYGGDEAFLSYLFSLFEKHGRQSLSELKAGLESADEAAIHHVAHRWRGSCLNVGAVVLADVLRGLEESSSVTTPGLIGQEDVWQQCADLFTRTCQQLRTQIPKPTPS